MGVWDEKGPGAADNGQSKNLMQMLGQLMQSNKLGGNMSPQAPGGQTPGRVGGAAPNMMQPPKINFSTQGAGAAMPAPAAPPPATNYGMQSDSGLMSKLDPKGAATYSAIQGVSQMLGQWQQKKEQKQQQEAANIAQNLMKASESGDTATVYEILNDPKSTKVLNKVYKGWLTKAQDASKQDKTDPDVAAFEQGIKAYIDGKPAQGGQPSAGGDARAQQPQMPRNVGGYMVPQALPAQIQQAATTNANLQKSQQDPNSMIGNQLSSEQTKMAQLIGAQLEISPKEIAILDASEQRAGIQAYAKIITEQQKQQMTTDRIMKATGMVVQGRQSVANTQQAGANKRNAANNATKKEIATIMSEAAKSKAAGKNNPDEMTRKLLDTQLKSLTALKNNVNTQYDQAMKSDKPEAATQFKQQMDGLDAQIKGINQQMDDLKSVGEMSNFNKTLEWLASGGAEEAPEGEENGDAN